MPKKSKPLPALGQSLQAAGYSAPSYQAVWQKVAQGALPQIVRVNNRLYFDDGDIEAIAAGLGLSPGRSPDAIE